MTKKGIKRASADFGLIAIVYNLKRMMNIIGFENQSDSFKKALETLFSGILSLFRPHTAVILKIKSLTNHFRKKAKNLLNFQIPTFHPHIIESFGYF